MYRRQVAWDALPDVPLENIDELYRHIHAFHPGRHCQGVAFVRNVELWARRVHDLPARQRLEAIGKRIEQVAKIDTTHYLFFAQYENWDVALYKGVPDICCCIHDLFLPKCLGATFTLLRDPDVGKYVISEDFL
jgi:hypothetical protein